MSATDRDFSDYVTARWSRLFRTAYVLCGADPRRAEELITAALARAYGAWPEIRSADDPDAHVRRLLVTSHSSWRTRRAWAGETTPDERLPPGAGEDATVPVADSTAVLEALTALPPGHRAVLLFRWETGLGAQQIAELLGWSSDAVMRSASDAARKLDDLLADASVPAAPAAQSTLAPARQDLGTAVRGAVAEVPVPVLPRERVLAAGHSRRRRRRGIVLGVVAVTCMAIVAAALTWDRANPRSAPAPAPVEADPVSWVELGVPWIDGGRIEYEDASIRRPPELVALAATADSAVLTVGRGPVTIIELRPDGTRNVLGRQAVGIALGDTAGHVAAWTEVVDSRTSRVVAYDTEAQEIIATTTVDKATQVYAMDGRTLVLNDGLDGYAWTAGSGNEPVRFSPGAQGQLVTDVTASYVFVTEFGVGSQLLDRDGGVITDFRGSRFSAGTFDPSGRFVSGLRPDESGSMNVHDVERAQVTGMQVSGDVGWTRWTADSRLVMRVTPSNQRLNYANTPVDYVICEPADGSCLPLDPSAETLRRAEGVEVGFLGQLTMTSTP